jgi:coproporphyrinogen III oxidase-like Fe-S oxidoreductase
MLAVTAGRSLPERESFERCFRAAPPEVDVEAIRREWTALRPPYQVENRRLPLPVWARRGFSETGEQAWAILRHDVAGMDPGKAFCIYLHIPFCARRCGFCDCYSFPLRRHKARHVDRYLSLLVQEARIWSRLGTLSRRPVSTVHLGGGTPTFLGEEPFGRLVQDLGRCFSMGPHTEWALESTTSELSDGMFAQLDRLGFTRLHVGVQSLQDDVRRAIHRREPATTVLAKIVRAVEMGWVVSVDLILGLPGQTLRGVLDDIKALETAGVDGFSLYELQLSSRNRRFAERHNLAGQGRLGSYFLLQATSRYLASLGYRKTLFNHFARQRDTNRYFTFPERGEDCLALGTIADGVFGDYHYRHPEYKAYCQRVGEAFPGLQGGLRRSAAENRLHPLEIALLAGHIPVELFEDVLGAERARALFRRWRTSALVEDDAQPGHLRLTANGSWFTGKMMAQLGSSSA